jgi:hypothetical protein
MTKSSFVKFVIVMFAVLAFWSCRSKEANNANKEKEYEHKLKEAQELAAKIKKGDLFNEEAVLREKLLKPESVCSLAADFSTNDFGPSPEFRGDGEAAIYADRAGTVHYYYFKDRRVYKMGINGRHPSFGMIAQNEGDQKFIYELFKLRENSWEGDIQGIVMNTEINWMNDPVLLTNIPGEDPFFANNDQNIIYHIGQNYFELDDKMHPNPVSKEQYEQLRDSRFPMENTWKTAPEHNGMQGLWLTDSDEKNWCELRSIKDLRTIRIIPSKYHIYVWGGESAGICMLRHADLNQYTVELKTAASVSPGAIFDVFEKELSPISQEVIGYKKDSFKGSIRVIKEAQSKYICEYQTKVYMGVIFGGDAAVLQGNNSIIGRIL